MAVRSDFVPEDVELDEFWNVKRREVRRRQSTLARLGDALFDLLDALGDIIKTFFKWAFFLAIPAMAIRSLWKHGGLWDFLAWAVIGVYVLGPVVRKEFM